MFRTVPLSINSNFSLHTQQWYMSYRFADSLRAGSGRSKFQNKFEKLVHLVGFIIRIYHDARSHERQMPPACFGVSYTVFREITGLLSQELYTFSNVVYICCSIQHKVYPVLFLISNALSFSQFFIAN